MKREVHIPYFLIHKLIQGRALYTNKIAIIGTSKDKMNT